MGVYQIVCEGTSVLREKAKEITKFNEATARLLDNLRDTLEATDTGVGLAAPQIGIAKQAVVIRTEEDGYYEMINPHILSGEGREDGWEGCLSIPGVEGLVPRQQKISVAYKDRQGKAMQLEAEGFFARVIQHEYDHLMGVLFTDRALEVAEIQAKED